MTLQRELSPNARNKAWHTISVRAEYKAKLVDLATANDISVNAMLQRLLDDAFDQYFRKEGDAPNPNATST